MFEVIRVNKTENFTIISNIHLRDDRLSLKTKGLMTIMLSLPAEKWNLSIAGLAEITHEGQSSIRTCLKQLETAGYFEKRPVHENGRIRRWEYVLNEAPKKQDVEIQDVEKQQVVKQDVELQHVEIQDVVNNTQLSTYSNQQLNTLNTYSNKGLQERSTDVDAVVQMWNQSGGLPIKRLSLTSTRGKMLKARIQEYGLESVLSAIQEYQNSSFLRGEKGFIADFEWFIKPNNFIKVLEGKYRDRPVMQTNTYQNQTQYFQQQAIGGNT